MGPTLDLLNIKNAVFEFKLNLNGDDHHASNQGLDYVLRFRWYAMQLITSAI